MGPAAQRARELSEKPFQRRFGWGEVMLWAERLYGVRTDSLPGPRNLGLQPFRVVFNMILYQK